MIAKGRKLLDEANLDALLITNGENRYYMSGFIGSDGVLLATTRGLILFTDFRYIEQARVECPDISIKCLKGPIYSDISDTIRENDIKTIGFEADDLSYNQFVKLQDHLQNIKLIPTNGLVEGLRTIKEGNEIAKIKHAAKIADQTFRYIVDLIKPGLRELDVALEMEYYMRKAGAEGISFEFIVASGIRSAYPHGVASDKKIEEGDMVTLDFGAVYKGYHSDMTRTIVVGSPTSKQKEIYEIVLEAQMTGIEAVRAGVKASEIDRASRSVIEKHGYGEYFQHSTGHGVGLAVHEEPPIALKNDCILQSGMIITVEPGIYLPGWGGVRIEDMVIVTEKGCDLITKSPKEKLMQIGEAIQ